MKWPWTRDTTGLERDRRKAERRVLEEAHKLAEARRVAESLAEIRQRNRFAEAMWIAFGGQQ
jgi:hypothetical protein